MPKVLIGPNLCGLRFNQALLQELYTLDAEKFFIVDEGLCENVRDEFESLVREYDIAGTIEDHILGESYRAIVGDFAYYPKDWSSNTIRTDEQFIGTYLKHFPLSDDVRLVTIPEDLRGWYIFCDDDGSESIHEEHRVWS